MHQSSRMIFFQSIDQLVFLVNNQTDYAGKTGSACWFVRDIGVHSDAVKRPDGATQVLPVSVR